MAIRTAADKRDAAGKGHFRSNEFRRWRYASLHGSVARPFAEAAQKMPAKFGEIVDHMPGAEFAWRDDRNAYAMSG
jgi:hypothetical protein